MQDDLNDKKPKPIDMEAVRDAPRQAYVEPKPKTIGPLYPYILPKNQPLSRDPRNSTLVAKDYDSDLSAATRFQGDIQGTRAYQYPGQGIADLALDAGDYWGGKATNATRNIPRTIGPLYKNLTGTKATASAATPNALTKPVVDPYADPNTWPGMEKTGNITPVEPRQPIARMSYNSDGEPIVPAEGPSTFTRPTPGSLRYGESGVSALPRGMTDLVHDPESDLIKASRRGTAAGTAALPKEDRVSQFEMSPEQQAEVEARRAGGREAMDSYGRTLDDKMTMERAHGTQEGQRASQIAHQRNLDYLTRKYNLNLQNITAEHMKAQAGLWNAQAKEVPNTALEKQSGKFAAVAREAATRVDELGNKNVDEEAFLRIYKKLTGEEDATDAPGSAPKERKSEVDPNVVLVQKNGKWVKKGE